MSNFLRKYKLSKLVVVKYTSDETKALAVIDTVFNNLRMVDLDNKIYYFNKNKLIFKYQKNRNRIICRWEDFWEPIYRYTIGYADDKYTKKDTTVDTIRYFLKEKLSLNLSNDIYSFGKNDQDTILIEEKFKI
jgi:hypothetical protein